MSPTTLVSWKSEEILIILPGYMFPKRAKTNILKWKTFFYFKNNYILA